MGSCSDIDDTAHNSFAELFDKQHQSNFGSQSYGCRKPIVTECVDPIPKFFGSISNIQQILLNLIGISSENDKWHIAFGSGASYWFKELMLIEKEKGLKIAFCKDEFIASKTSSLLLNPVILEISTEK